MVFEWKTSFETVFRCISTFSGLSLSWHQFSISISHICSQSEFYSIDWYRPTFTQWSFITEVEIVFGIQRNNEATSVFNFWRKKSCNPFSFRIVQCFAIWPGDLLTQIQKDCRIAAKSLPLENIECRNRKSNSGKSRGNEVQEDACPS